MLLSVIVHGRADDYMGDFLWRIQTTLNKLGDCLEAVDGHSELILLDWGSKPSRKLKDSIVISDTTRKRLRLMYVDPDTVKSVGPDADYSSSHAVNCAVRRTLGKHILACDSDVYCPTHTMAELWWAMANGHFQNDARKHDINKHFFWSARRHIPLSFNSARPPIQRIDQHILEHGHSYQLDKPDPHHFQGATCALLATREMWHAIRGLNENMLYRGVNDICIHHRLKMLYGYGGDVDDYGLKFYHLEHYVNRHVYGENTRRANDYIMPSGPITNGENWGLRDQPVLDSVNGPWWGNA